MLVFWRSFFWNSKDAEFRIEFLLRDFKFTYFHESEGIFLIDIFLWWEFLYALLFEGFSWYLSSMFESIILQSLYSLDLPLDPTFKFDPKLATLFLNLGIGRLTFSQIFESIFSLDLAVLQFQLFELWSHAFLTLRSWTFFGKKCMIPLLRSRPMVSDW